MRLSKLCQIYDKFLKIKKIYCASGGVKMMRFTNLNGVTSKPTILEVKVSGSL